MNQETNCRVIARNVLMNNDTRATGINNNDLIIGPSGAGKTRGYVIPNILQANESLIVADTKGNLCRMLGPYLRKRGYQVIDLDLTDVGGSDWGYNPLDFIRYDRRSRTYNEQDIMTISNLLSPVRSTRDPFWEQSAQMYLQALIAYVMECLPKGERNLTSVVQLSDLIGTAELDNLFRDLSEITPNSFAVTRYRCMVRNRAAATTESCIRGTLATTLMPLSFHGIQQLFRAPKQVRFDAIGEKKTAVFLTISDTDRAMDGLANLFYAQAFQNLCARADRNFPACSLPVPVRFILDDFATNTLIPNFDSIISVIRSRGISVSLIIQSLSQLEGLYGHAKSQTIINNCDTCLYLGGQDVQTASYIGTKLNKTVQTVLDMPLQTAFVFSRGQKPSRCEKYLPEEHPRYEEAMACIFGAQRPAKSRRSARTAANRETGMERSAS